VPELAPFQQQQEPHKKKAAAADAASSSSSTSWHDVRNQFMRVVRQKGPQAQHERERFLTLWTRCAAQTWHVF